MLAFFLSPSPLRLCLHSLRFSRSLVRFRRRAEQPLHDAPLLVRYPCEGVPCILVAHGETVA